jgi:hypothetical protein
MDAALKLNEIARKDEGAIDRARILADMGRIIDGRTPLQTNQVLQRPLESERQTPVSQQTSQPVERVRMVDIDDSPDEDGD